MAAREGRIQVDLWELVRCVDELSASPQETVAVVVHLLRRARWGAPQDGRRPTPGDSARDRS